MHRARGYSEISLQAVPETTPDAENSASPSGIITKRRHVLVGVEGTAMTVLHERYFLNSVLNSFFLTLFPLQTSICPVRGVLDTVQTLRSLHEQSC